MSREVCVLAVHGLWSSGGRFALWAEDATLPRSPRRRPGRPPRVRQHPFAAGNDRLAAAIGDHLPGGVPGSLLLLLPTTAGAPGDSPELGSEPGPAGQTTLATWQVPAITFDPAAALGLAGPGGPGGLAGPGSATGWGRADGAGPWDSGDLVAGASLRHLVELARFAVDLVARGRLLPTVQRGPGGRHAAWRPLVTGADAAWAVALADAMPPVGRAEVPGTGPATGRARTGAPAGAARPGPDPGAARPGPDAAGVRPGPDAAGCRPGAGELVAAAVDALVDAAARSVLGGREPGGATGVRGLAGRGRGVTAARAWLGALTGQHRAVAADPAAVAELDAALAAWQRDAAGGPLRACFRLAEPPAPDQLPDLPAPAAAPATDVAASATVPDLSASAAGPDRGGAAGQGWQVAFALQATDDPSLVVSADLIWSADRTGDRSGALAALTRNGAAPQEAMLAELGRAARLWPELQPALRRARPDGVELTAGEAHHFLRERAPLLAAAGFGVLLPAWWGRQGARLGARLSARATGARSGGPPPRTAPGTVARPAGFGLDAITEYQWEIALGDEILTEQELTALAELRAPLVRVRGQWVELDQAKLAAGLHLLRTGGQMTVGELLRTGLAGEDGGPGGLPVLEVRAEGSLGDLLAGAVDQRLSPVAEPEGFVGRLRPYQRRGLAWLSFLQSLGLGAVLADDMGLGKTVQVLALLAADPADAGPTLLICPMSLVGNWRREAERFAPGLRVHVHHGAERARGAGFADAVRDADLVLTTYTLAARDAAALAGIDWHRVVIDEAQAVKNAATRQAVAVRAIPARYRLAMTGTPVENRLADLWSIMQFANPGLLGTAADFKRRYAEPVERHDDAAAAERLRRITGPFVLRRVKTDRSIIADLPEKLEMEVLCNLTAEQASLYQAVVDDMLDRIEHTDGMERRGLVLATMAKLKQVCNHPAQLLRDGTRLAGRSGKLARLEEILEEVLASGEKALLFTQFAAFGAMLRAHLGARFGREVLFLHGGVDQVERDAMVTRFQQERSGAPALFVLSLRAGGTGLTLTAANHVVHVDRWWNPAVEDQATDRAFRIGQRRAVQVRKFVCAGTLEERIAQMITEKRGLAARIVGTGEQWLTELSTAQLRDLIALDAGAVVE